MEAAAGRSSETLYTRRQHLQRFARVLGGSPADVTTDGLLAWFSRNTHWAIETRRSYLNTARSFFTWTENTTLTTTNPEAGLPGVKPSPPAPRPTPDSIYQAALAQADPRCRLILRLAAEVGLRRGEVAVGHSRDLFHDLDGWSLVVHGKGGKERTLPLPHAIAAELRELGPGWFFPGDLDGHLSPRWVGTLISRTMPHGWTMHKLRHRFASRAYAGSKDLLALQILLGHATPTTTQAYVAVTQTHLRETVNAAK